MKIKGFEDIEACRPDLWQAGSPDLWRADMQGEPRRSGTAVHGFISYLKRYEEKCKATNREP